MGKLSRSSIVYNAFAFFLTHYVLLTTHCFAAVPQLIHYQGRLTEANQAPLAGAHTVTLRIYDAETGGTALWQETHPITLTSQDRGIFSVLLGSLKSFGALTFNQPLWLAIEVDGEGEMSPRQRFTAVGYAINADTLDGLRSQQFMRSDVPLPFVRLDAPLSAVRSLAAVGQPALQGEVTLAAGPHVTLSQSGQTMTVSAEGANPPAAGNNATAAASSFRDLHVHAESQVERQRGYRHHPSPDRGGAVVMPLLLTIVPSIRHTSD